MILVTGSNGLLGRNLIQSLSRENEVHALVRVLPPDPVPHVHYHAVNLSELGETGSLPKRMDTIIHLAQSSHFRDFPERALDVFRVNVESTAWLLDYATRSEAKHFIYASSGGVYGSGNRAFDENSPIVATGDLGYYLGSKLCGEVLVQNYASLMQVTVLRFFFMYGALQKRSMLIPRLVDNIKASSVISLQGQDGIRINPVHVDDATQAIISLVASGKGKSATFNIAGPDVLTLREIASIIGNKLSTEPEFQILGGEPSDLVADNSAMRKELHEPEVHFDDGVQGLI
jgi:UDP-glucose 4-epimerase